MEPHELIFVVDLNEISEGGLVPIAADFTVNLGPRVKSSQVPTLRRNDWVKVHSDDDNTLYHAQVRRVLSDRDYLVKIDWDSCRPVLNSEWSARVEEPFHLGMAAGESSATQPAQNLAKK